MLNDALLTMRKYHRISQTELSQSLGISNSYLSEIESGKKKPTLELLDKYSEYFDIPVSSLMLFSENMDKKDTLSGKFRYFTGSKVIKLMNWLSENGK